MKRTLFTFLALIVLGFYSPSVDAGFSRVVESVRPLQAIVQTELKNICTITSINQAKGLWLTASHCVGQPTKDPNVAYIFNTYIEGEKTSVAYFNAITDLAILHTENHHAKALHMQSSA